MDYFVMSTVAHGQPKVLRLSYDIGCQYLKHHLERCDLYATLEPNVFSANEDLHVTYNVPKFHLPAHIVECQVQFNHNYTPGVGRTDGEAPERGWSDSNDLGKSTRPMGPGSRHDTIDDDFGATNWAKSIGMGMFACHASLTYIFN